MSRLYPHVYFNSRRQASPFIRRNHWRSEKLGSPWAGFPAQDELLHGRSRSRNTLCAGGFQEWSKVLEVGPVCVRLTIGVFAAGPVGPVGFVPADKADISIGRDARHVLDRFLEALGADGDNLIGFEWICRYQPLDDVVHRITRPARVNALGALSKGLLVGGVPSVENAIQIGPCTPGFLRRPVAATIKVAGGLEAIIIRDGEHIGIDAELLPLLHGSLGIARIMVGKDIATQIVDRPGL